MFSRVGRPHQPYRPRISARYYRCYVISGSNTNTGRKKTKQI